MGQHQEEMRADEHRPLGSVAGPSPRSRYLTRGDREHWNWSDAKTAVLEPRRLMMKVNLSRRGM